MYDRHNNCGMFFTLFPVKKPAMFRNATFAAIFSTSYLLAYLIMLHVPAWLPYAELMLLLSPVVILWLVIVALKFGKHNDTTLHGEEFGYQDRNKGDLGIF